MKTEDNGDDGLQNWLLDAELRHPSLRRYNGIVYPSGIDFVTNQRTYRFRFDNLWKDPEYTEQLKDLSIEHLRLRRAILVNDIGLLANTNPTDMKEAVKGLCEDAITELCDCERDMAYVSSGGASDG